MILALLTAVAGAQAPDPVQTQESRTPIIGPTSWSDSLDDRQGLSWLDGTRHLPGQVTLSQLEPLGEDVGAIWSIAEGPNGIFYLGIDNARLWSYDSTTGEMMDLGAPVPGECDT